MAHCVFSDAMFVSTMSRRSNICAQEYVTDFEWAAAFPMASRIKANEILSLLFTWDGVTPACICNNANEIIQIKFYQKLKDAVSQVKQFEPCTPWSNAAGREIKEFNKGTSHKLSWSSAPKSSWNKCLEWEAYIRSNTAHNILKLDGEVPKAVMSGETSGISQFCKLE